MMKKSLFSLEGRKISLSHIVGGATPTCLGQECDIMVGLETCFQSDIKVTGCNPQTGYDTDESIRDGGFLFAGVKSR